MYGDSLFFGEHVVVLDEVILFTGIFTAAANLGAPVEQVDDFQLDQGKNNNADHEMETQNCGVTLQVVPVPDFSRDFARNNYVIGVFRAAVDNKCATG